MVKIKTQYKVIDLEKPNGEKVGEVVIDMSDANVKRLMADVKTLEAEMKEQNTNDEEEFKKFLKRAIDSMLGVGTFNMLYSITPSLMLTALNFLAIAEEIQREIVEETQQKASAKYLQPLT